LDEEILGEIRLVQADFAFHTAFNPKGRLFAPELGGGALLDAGIYPVSLASFIYGKQPEHLTSIAHKGETGVDDRTSMQFAYEGGGMAQLFCATQLNTLNEAVIAGDKGIIRLHARWLSGSALTITHPGQEAQFISAPIANNNGYSYEAAEVGRCLRAGLLESQVMPLAETIAIMQTMDRIQQQW
ncbi:MAG: gfo/Idh/MocA family oxidoreductase, partial [Anaerolineae bacterium]|nr:gfo/Idh/MocA family oxidoreductase [Anaerolineae bacterium]